MRVFYSVHPLIASNILGPGATAALTAAPWSPRNQSEEREASSANVAPPVRNRPDNPSTRKVSRQRTFCVLKFESKWSDHSGLALRPCPERRRQRQILCACLDKSVEKWHFSGDVGKNGTTARPAALLWFVPGRLFGRGGFGFSGAGRPRRPRRPRLGGDCRFAQPAPAPNG